MKKQIIVTSVLCASLLAAIGNVSAQQTDVNANTATPAKPLMNLAWYDRWGYWHPNYGWGWGGGGSWCYYHPYQCHGGGYYRRAWGWGGGWCGWHRGYYGRAWYGCN